MPKGPTTKRSRVMSAIRRRDTGPEMQVRSALHRSGLRFRVDDRRLPGRPDLVLKKHNCAIFVHGCFWHGHDCSFFRWPKTEAEFWRTKIEANRARDLRAGSALEAAGWRVATVWECCFRDQSKSDVERQMQRLHLWISSGSGPRTLTLPSGQR